MSTLKDALLRVPVSPRRGNIPDSDVTVKLEASDGSAVLELRQPGEVPASESDAKLELEAQGLNPDDWAVASFRTSRWTMPGGGEGVSTRFNFVPASTYTLGNIDDLIAVVDAAPKIAPPPAVVKGAGVIVALGDMQFGKADGEEFSAEDSVERTVRVLREAAAQIAADRPDRPHVAVTWLGDHIEGFVSQKGANAWRTQLTLNEQLRLLRRVMMYAVEVLAPVAGKLTMIAVPGNHGEPQRFEGTGITRYDDSHDTEALIAVMDACALAPDKFGHVEFFVPDTDELTVVADIANTRILCAHGHKWRPGKQMEWWKGLTFNGGAGSDAHILLYGHLHHFTLDTEGHRTSICVPALETASNWWRHLKGTVGSPGLLLVHVVDGQLLKVEAVR